jgi:RecG-like helicase
MPLLETVTLEVGAAIAKSILKLWLKDSNLGQDITSSLIDLFKAKTSDKLAQKRGERQFEAIGEKVGESLLPLFESEATGLDESGRTAVAIAVAEAFNISKLSSELLAERNLQPTQLAHYVLAMAKPNATRDFSAAEEALYKRIIQESCGYIVDIASQLPSFTERTFAEVLKRENQILDKTNEILAELRQMRKNLDPMVAVERFEIEYRQAVARNLDVLQLFGADVSLPNRRHRLSVAYITLSVEQKIPAQSASIKLSLDDAQQDVENIIVPADTVLSSSRRLLIRGPAGSGKTTLLQWVAVKAATKSFEGVLSNWNGFIPFYMLRKSCQSPKNSSTSLHQ